LLIDYHVHLDKLEWTVECIEDMCRYARDNKVDKIGVVVHTKILEAFAPLYAHVLAGGTKRKKLKLDRNIEKYIEILELAKSKGFPVETGIEVCYSPEGEEFLQSKLRSYPFDYIIGSVHLIKDMHYKTAVEMYKDVETVGRIYYELVLKAVQSKLFNIIGHIELARREGIPGLDSYPDLLDKISTALVENNCAVEINTKWLVKRDYIVPNHNTLNYMAQRGVRVVFGSDAHHKDRIGYEKETASKAIKNSGFDGFSIVRS